MASAAAPSNDHNNGDDLKAALKMLDDVGQAGLVLVPLEPTDAMVAAAMQVGEVSEAQIMAIYFAMLATAAEE